MLVLAQLLGFFFQGVMTRLWAVVERLSYLKLGKNINVSFPKPPAAFPHLCFHCGTKVSNALLGFGNPLQVQQHFFQL